MFEFQDATGWRAQGVPLRPAELLVTFTATISAQRARAAEPGDSLGPGPRRHGAASGGGSFFTGNSVSAAAGDLLTATATSSACCPRRSPKQPVHEGPFRFAGIDDHYFIAAAVTSRAGRVEFRPLTLPGANDTQRRAARRSTFDRRQRAGQAIRFFVGPKQFDCCRSLDARAASARSTSACSPGSWCRCSAR